LATKGKRVRRRPEDAKRLILDAAEASMAAEGPAGLRLQDVARLVGVSHPTILHHFGSREGLVRELNRRTLEELKSMALRQIGAANPNGEGIRLTFAAYRGGLAQRVMWLLQSSTQPVAGERPLFDEIVNALHEVRLRIAKPGATVDIADSRAIIHLITIAAFGDAIIGARLREFAGEADPDAGARFETWFKDLVFLHIVTQAGKD
jgi:AcrR family transcriptional regulator